MSKYVCRVIADADVALEDSLQVGASGHVLRGIPVGDLLVTEHDGALAEQPHGVALLEKDSRRVTVDHKQKYGSPGLNGGEYSGGVIAETAGDGNAREDFD